MLTVADGAEVQAGAVPGRGAAADSEDGLDARRTRSGSVHRPRVVGEAGSRTLSRAASLHH